jgi:hypothetical protein
MHAFWVTFDGRQSACVEAKDETEAKQLAKELTGKEAKTVNILPYPAEPRLNKPTHECTDGSSISIPSFCYSPASCAGRTACPRRLSCTE